MNNDPQGGKPESKVKEKERKRELGALYYRKRNNLRERKEKKAINTLLTFSLFYMALLVVVLLFSRSFFTLLSYYHIVSTIYITCIHLLSSFTLKVTLWAHVISAP